MSALVGELAPYLVMILVGFLPNEVWRFLGLYLARGLNEKSEIVTWVRAVAVATLAGVIAKLIVFPSGALLAAPPAVRYGAFAIGLVVFVLARRSVMIAALTSVAALIAGTYVLG